MSKRYFRQHETWMWFEMYECSPKGGKRDAIFEWEMELFEFLDQKLFSCLCAWMLEGADGRGIFGDHSTGKISGIFLPWRKSDDDCDFFRNMEVIQEKEREGER